MGPAVQAPAVRERVRCYVIGWTVRDLVGLQGHRDGDAAVAGRGDFGEDSL